MSALRVISDAAAAGSLVHPLRRRILDALAAPDSASGVARRLSLPRQQVNYHLRELEAAGLVALKEERRKGNCTERIVCAVARAYVVDPAALTRLGTDQSAPQDRFSSTYQIAGAARLLSEVAALRERAEAAGKRLATLTLESEIRFRSAEERAQFASELTDALARLTAKYHDATAPGGREFRVFAAVRPALLPDGARAPSATNQDRPPAPPEVRSES